MPRRPHLAGAPPMIGPGWFDREDALRRLADDPFDVLVVGGGITGVGVALDAASRGLRTALVERGDFASGTSSKSSKLAHGGLRYLQQGEIRLVYQALHERQRLRHNAPHLVKLLPFLLPVLTGKGSVIPKKLSRALGISMWMYDLTGGARIGKLHERISAEETLAHMPTLPEDKLAASYLYYDATVDDARLTLTVARTAAIEFGAVAANGVSLVGIDKDAKGQVQGATVLADGEEIRVRCRAVVNAAGVWSDEVRHLDEGVDPDSIRPAKGIHITVPWGKVRNDVAVVVPVPQDKRSVFVVPWGDLTYIGTTDTDYDGPLDDPACTEEDVDYLLRAMKFTGITRADVVGTWAGLRPLVKSKGSGKTADLSRRHKVNPSESGVVTITGGKLTTYREMAADTVDAVVEHLGSAIDGVAKRSRTKKLRLRGAEGYDALALDADPVIAHLANRYGGETATVLALADADPSLREPLVEGLPYIRAEAVYAVRYEMARSVDDVLSRRTRARLLARDASAAAAGDVADLIAPILGLTADEAAEQAATYRAAVELERTQAGLPETALEAVSLGEDLLAP
ncbi:glycerol-3-phosphate dehydrogenase/oxidase [Aquihabitans sp. G128]|uniref:glycerol-3-phosphate dehydrogenase/oxidase n=1 Tax=Aquihabitans sp. G128 TaxID=2849779 RepID=UPI001C24169F|nr:glycerol-3-phosphate dehydrogenase/oxidase [Aquihabitans sp. G128]QXC62337.1 glycerol-3-phosphate dehydrogenase/oxidase [Aquihabitans sp. G128]